MCRGCYLVAGAQTSWVGVFAVVWGRCQRVGVQGMDEAQWRQGQRSSASLHRVYFYECMLL